VILILNKLGTSVAEAIRAGPPPMEITRKESERMRVVHANRATTMPGAVLKVHGKDCLRRIRGHSSVCKKLYAKEGNYEGNGCYIQVD
jgi:hypothetical protein